MHSISAIPLPDGHLDLIQGVAVRGGERLALTPIEIAALTVLAEAMPEPVSEEALLRAAWGYRTTKTRTVSVAMSRMRAKIEPDPRSPRVLLTVRGQGYRLAVVAPAAAPPPVPQAEHAIGRESERAAVRERFESGARVVELIGPGGAGKTTLARDLQRGAVWVDLVDARTSATLVRRLAGALGAEGAVGEEMVRTRLGSGRRVVIDNAEDLDTEARQVLARILEDRPAHVLITTREPLGLGKPVLIGDLSAEHALAVVNRARAELGLPEAAAEDLEPVLAAFGGHALALVVAAPVMELAPTPEVVLAMPPLVASAPLAAVLEQTIVRLPDDERDLLAAVAAFAVPPVLADLAEMTEQPLPLLLRALHGLRGRGLLTLTGGVVAVHPYIRHGARLPEWLERHVDWVASCSPDPHRLHRIRHEIEAVLPRASGNALAAVLLRHVLVLHNFGPHERLMDDLAQGLARLPPHGQAEILRGAAFVALDEVAAAVPVLRAGLDALDDDQITWRAWGAFYLTIAGDSAMAAWAVEQLLELRERIEDPALQCFVSLQLAVNLSRGGDPRADALYREVEAHADTQPVPALIAWTSRLMSTDPTPSELEGVQGRIDAIGEPALGEVPWMRRWIELGRLWLLAGNHERGLALLETYGPTYAERDPRRAGFALGLCAVLCLDRPDLTARIRGWIPETHPMQERIGWLLDPQGEPPVEDADLAILMRRWRDGEAITTRPTRWKNLAIALSAVQQRQP